MVTANQDACATGSTIEDPAKCIELGLKLGYVEGLSADHGADHVQFLLKVSILDIYINVRTPDSSVVLIISPTSFCFNVFVVGI